MIDQVTQWPGESDPFAIDSDKQINLTQFQHW